jgi:hypothetical protein
LKPDALLLVAACCLLFISARAEAATYYVRRDGGAAGQCTGTADLPYPGSGTGQACAWSHPFWALRGEGETASWRMQGGDTLIISRGKYKMGYGAPNSGWCNADWPWGCHLPPLPSGPSPDHPTRILGKGWRRGCAHPPELWGTQRADFIIDLTGTSNAGMECLDITDHSSCAEFHHDEAFRCQRDTFPFGKWAARGIFAKDSSNVKVRNLRIHGLAAGGIHAGRIRNWTLDRVEIVGNGSVGWDGDIWENSSNSGRILFRRARVEWNGCVETYPDKQIVGCWDQEYGGYGDGIATAATGGHWIFRDSVVSHNTQDGIDLLYANRAGAGNSLVEVRRTVVEGNAGNQVKINGSAIVENSLLIGNCAFFEGKPFAQSMGLHCRAGGGTLALFTRGGDSIEVVNSTIVGQGDGLIGVACDQDRPSCDATDQVLLANNIMRGYGDYFDPEDQVAFVWVDDESETPFQGTVKADHNMAFDVKFSPTFAESRDPNIVVANPMFAIPLLNSLDAHLQPGSQAVNSGLPVGRLNGLIPDHDIERTPRPCGTGVDRGAYELIEQ